MLDRYEMVKSALTSTEGDSWIVGAESQDSTISYQLEADGSVSIRVHGMVALIVVYLFLVRQRPYCVHGVW